jgi:lipopolysaccharide/colanic/teichoic acid biosynthesis glycosyltransferase
MYKTYFKRIVDFIVASVMFLIVSPVLLIIAILLALVNKGSPFFLQTRPGKDEKLFKIIKFRTMTGAIDDKGVLFPDEKRVTSIGKMIRKTSLDELPQLINVIKGDMSLIGPRPLLVEYLPLYNSKQKERHNVKPGITGWAQINGRNLISWKQKLEYDVWYVDHISFMLDVKIFFKTIIRVIKSENIYSGSKITMNRFNGNN